MAPVANMFCVRCCASGVPPILYRPWRVCAHMRLGRLQVRTDFCGYLAWRRSPLAVVCDSFTRVVGGSLDDGRGGCRGGLLVGAAVAVGRVVDWRTRWDFWGWWGQ